MSSASRRAELFVVEAEEYLADLDLVTGSRDLGDAERMVRGARALRGAAMFAGFGTYARASAGVEALARQLRDNSIEWDAATREEVISALAILRELLTRAPAWDATGDREALALAERLERFGGGAPSRLINSATQLLTSGVRAFIARESALIAGSLERAARALSPMPPPDALAAVLERMRSLRGLGASAELSPLPEVLDAMEIATRTLLGDDPPPPDVSEVFDEAARALATMAREIAETGRVVAPPELDRVAMRLLSAYAEERDVVPVNELAPEGEESVLFRGTAPAPPPGTGPVPIELVGVGDHLLLIADTLARPTSPVVRDLRLFVLHRTLATMPPRSATGQFLAPLTHAINGAISHGIAGRQLDRFIGMLRDTGRFLIDSGAASDLGALIRERDRIVVVLLRGELGAALSVPLREEVITSAQLEVGDLGTLVEEVEQMVSIDSLAPEPASIREITQLFVTHDEPLEVRIETTPEEAEESPSDFEWNIVPMETIIPDPSKWYEPVPPVTPIASVAPAPPVMTDAVPPSVAATPSALTSATTESAETSEGDDSLSAEPIVSINSLLESFAPGTDAMSPMDDDLIGTPIVPIEALAFEPTRSLFPGLIPRLAPGEPSRLEQAWRSVQELQRNEEDQPASIEGLVGEEVFPVERLLYRGPSALTRAAEVRTAISQKLRTPAISLETLRPDIEELLDLVALARDAA